MKNIHIPTIEELMRPEPRFGVEELTDGYRISGIQYRGQKCTYDFAKNTLPKQTQDEHAEHASHAKDTEFKASNAPLIYAICKTLYHNRYGEYNELVEKARKTLEAILIGHNWICTLSQAIYYTTGQGKIIHDYKQKTQYSSKQAQLAGQDGDIRKPETQAEDYTHALLDTTNSMQEIDDVFKWATGKDTHAWRTRPVEKQMKSIVAFGFTGSFSLGAGNDMGDNHPALGVRLVK